MREIKFRVWDEEAEKLVYSDGACGTDETKYIWQVTLDSVVCKRSTLSFDVVLAENYRDCEIYTYEELQAESMQYTGLKDKNGVEIYEMDVVNWYMDFGYGSQEIIAEVIYEEQGFKYKSGAEIDFIRGFNDVEVIGNIYENPELLEK